MRDALLAGLLLWGLSTPAAAEVLTWTCMFQQRIDAGGISEEPMTLTFKIDTLSQRALMEGNAGIVDVNMFVGDEAVSFMEPVASGAVQTTTVTGDGLAVHSRNTVILGELVAAQHFGRCDFG